ncbi:MAG: hypothetical protein RIE32_10555 [Phycisphaerales bacterium]
MDDSEVAAFIAMKAWLEGKTHPDDDALLSLCSKAIQNLDIERREPPEDGELQRLWRLSFYLLCKLSIDQSASIVDRERAWEIGKSIEEKCTFNPFERWMQLVDKDTRTLNAGDFGDFVAHHADDRGYVRVDYYGKPEYGMDLRSQSAAWGVHPHVQHKFIRMLDFALSAFFEHHFPETQLPGQVE